MNKNKKLFVPVLLISILLPLSHYGTTSNQNNPPATPISTSPKQLLVSKHDSNIPKSLPTLEPVYHNDQTNQSNTKNYATEWLKNNEIQTQSGMLYPLRTYRPAIQPNDPQADQWWTESIQAPESWDYAAGEQTILAVIDTGFALNHTEFADRLHQNTAEMGTTAQEAPSMLNCTNQGIALDKSCNNIDDDQDGIVDNESGPTTLENRSFLNCTDQGIALDKSCNLVDDDGNGLADDVHGWDFINFDRSAQAGETNPAGNGTTHGTLVSGVAAATGNNGTGLAGVDWHTKILPLQALDDDSYGNSLSVGRAIRYAIDQGADVINLSLGSEQADSFTRNVIAEAIAAGIIVVAAAGNDGCECMIYPARYPEVLAVGAHDSTGSPASFSSTGENLDILAPGVSLYTTNWSATNQTNAYAYASGTSLATPVVSGVLTRLRAHLPEANSTQLVAALLESANKNLIPDGSYGSSTLGFGNLLAGTSLSRVTTPLTTRQLYAFEPVRWQNNLRPATPYQCDHGTSVIFNSTTNRFAISGNNKTLANHSLFSHACILLPHDTPEIIRSIHLQREFKNTFIKE